MHNTKNMPPPYLSFPLCIHADNESDTGIFIKLSAKAETIKLSAASSFQSILIVLLFHFSGKFIECRTSFVCTSATELDSTISFFIRYYSFY